MAYIEYFPSDLSSLKELEILDVRDHGFDLESLIPALQTLPNLKALYIDITSDEEFRDLFSNLASLELLNSESADSF